MRLLLLSALPLAIACATAGTAGAGSAGDARSCSAATADRGAVVYVRPDSTSDAVTTLADRAQLCADPSTVGFGFRHVKLGDGREGYVAEDQLSL